MAENVPLQGKIFCCTLSFFASTVFESGQTRVQLVVSLKHAKVSRILLQVQKITFFSHVLRGCTAAVIPVIACTIMYMRGLGSTAILPVPIFGETTNCDTYRTPKPIGSTVTCYNLILHCTTLYYSQTSPLIRSSFIRIPRHPEENS